MGAKPPKISEIPDKFVLNLASLEYKIEIKAKLIFCFLLLIHHKPYCLKLNLASQTCKARLIFQYST